MTSAYDEAMLEWAVAELMSPHWRSIPNWIWANPVWDAWRQHVETKGPRGWTPEQARVLIQAIETSRKPIIEIYGPAARSRILRRELRVEHLAALQVMPEFFPPGGTLRQLLDWIRARPDYAPEKTAAIQSMAPQLKDGAWPFGALIVVQRPEGANVLIEGYKRALASLAAGRSATPAILVAG